MPIDSNFINNTVLILSAWGAAFLAALWISLLIWTFRDIRSRTRDRLLQLLALLIVALLFLPGIVVYLILRPSRSLDEEYQQTLEEEALLQAIEESQLCPGCSRRIKENWVVCPNCHTRLKKNCHQCGKLMELPWHLCPYCGTPAPGMRRENMTMDEALRPAGSQTDPSVLAGVSLASRLRSGDRNLMSDDWAQSTLPEVEDTSEQPSPPEAGV